jgi:hypothetical protein
MMSALGRRSVPIWVFNFALWLISAVIINDSDKLQHSECSKLSAEIFLPHYISYPNILFVLDLLVFEKSCTVTYVPLKLGPSKDKWFMCNMIICFMRERYCKHLT